MPADAAVINFGEFLRSRVVARGRIKDVADAAGIDVSTLQRYTRSAAPEPLRIEHYNKLAAAKAAGYETWEELDAAWRVTPVVPVERRGKKQWGAEAAADARLARAGGKFDFSKFTAEQCRGVIAEAKRRLVELGEDDDA